MLTLSLAMEQLARSRGIGVPSAITGQRGDWLVRGLDLREGPLCQRSGLRSEGLGDRRGGRNGLAHFPRGDPDAVFQTRNPCLVLTCFLKSSSETV